MRDTPGQGLRIAGAQPQRGLGDQFDVLGVGLGQVQGARTQGGDDRFDGAWQRSPRCRRHIVRPQDFW